MSWKNLAALLSLFSIFSVRIASAHCPLCTIGAAAAAGGAAYLGVNNIIIGLFIGAFAASMGFWVARMIKKKYIPFQTAAIVLASFLTTILPILPLMPGIKPLYISIAGDYGSLLNRTYVYNVFLVGSIVGSIIVLIVPLISGTLTRARNGKTIPFQGTTITLAVLLLLGVIFQLVM